MANCHEAVGYRKLSGHYAGNGEIMTWLTATVEAKKEGPQNT